MKKEDVEYLVSKIENEGLDYLFVSYSRFDDIEDEKFHELRKKFLDARKALVDYIETVLNTLPIFHNDSLDFAYQCLGQLADWNSTVSNSPPYQGIIQMAQQELQKLDVELQKQKENAELMAWERIKKIASSYSVSSREKEEEPIHIIIDQNTIDKVDEQLKAVEILETAEKEAEQWEDEQKEVRKRNEPVKFFESIHLAERYLTDIKLTLPMDYARRNLILEELWDMEKRKGKLKIATVVILRYVFFLEGLVDSKVIESFVVTKSQIAIQKAIDSLLGKLDMPTSLVDSLRSQVKKEIEEEGYLLFEE